MAIRWLPATLVHTPSVFEPPNAGTFFIAYLTAFTMTWQTLPAAIRHAAQSLLLRPLYYPATLPVARLGDEMDQRLHALFDQPGKRWRR